MHPVGNCSGIVQIGIVRIDELKRPTAAFRFSSVKLPVLRSVDQLFFGQPGKSFFRRRAALLVADLLERKRSPRGVPHGRHARLAISAALTDDQQIIDCLSLLHAQRMVGWITQ